MMYKGDLTSISITSSDPDAINNAVSICTLGIQSQLIENPFQLSFEPGSLIQGGLWEIVHVANEDLFGIVVNSRAYLFKVTDPDNLEAIEIEPVKVVICSESAGVAFASDSDLCFISTDRKSTFSRQVASDGIRNLKFDGKFLKGEAWVAWQNDWLPFLLDCENLKFEGSII